MATETVETPKPENPKPQKSKRQPYVRDFEEGLVYLFQYPRLKEFPNLSPFCLKLETWLRFSEIKYKMVENLSVMHRSSEGTLPYIELNGEAHNDSAFIIRDLPQLLGVKSLDAHLSEQDQAISLAFERLIENSLFLGSGKFRYDQMEKVLALWPSKFGFAQPLFNAFIKHMMTTKLKEKLNATGLGRHTNEEILGVVCDDLQALNRQLGNKQYLMGDKPTKIDASAFAALALITLLPFDTPPKTHILEKLPNLQKYTERIKEKYYPDWSTFTS
ncbi:Failed axon connections-like protein [Aphelenchoides bicaudatus]|nr:Failed axon connections-like protein [Aphelenchoides bicaudatus]